MDDMISRQAAIDVLHEYFDTLLDTDTVCPADIYGLLETLPSAQPEIIRCGQCKYAEVADEEDDQDGYICQFHRGSIWFSGSYCSWAERGIDE